MPVCSGLKQFFLCLCVRTIFTSQKQELNTHSERFTNYTIHNTRIIVFAFVFAFVTTHRVTLMMTA